MANTFIPSPWEAEAVIEVSQPGLKCDIKDSQGYIMETLSETNKNIICCWVSQNSRSVVVDALSFWEVFWSSTELKSLWPLVSSCFFFFFNTKRLSTRFLIYLTIQGWGRQLPSILLRLHHELHGRNIDICLHTQLLTRIIVLCFGPMENHLQIHFLLCLGHILS